MTTATYDNFSKLEIRTGEVITVNEFERARNPSYKVEIDFGNGDRRWSSAQITKYRKNELLGKQVICITNLPERNIAGFMSQVLILGVPDSDNNTILLTTDIPVAQGSQVF